MNKKLFVLLEQGNKCNTSLSKEHKKQFTTEYSDFYRLNWKADNNDKEACIYKKNIVWSEGRSELFLHVKNKYHYYVFIDDDVKFHSKTNKSIAEELYYFFTEYKPLSGTIHGENWAWDLYNHQIMSTPSLEVFPIMVHDLCCHFFKDDFAQLMFPVYFNGSECSMWYAQFIAYKLFPEKCMVFNNLYIQNTEHIPHSDKNNSQYINGKKILLLFSELIKEDKLKNEFMNWLNPFYIRNMNKQIFKNTINKNEISFTLKELSNIINYKTTQNPL